MAKYYLNTNGRISLEIEEAELKYGAWFSNWSGRTDGEFKYNGIDRETGEGYKYFTIKLPSEFINELDGKTYTVDDLAELGIPVKTYPGNPEKGYDDEHTLKVKVAFKFRPPMIQVDVAGDIDVYGANEVHRLDNLAINNPDLVVGFGRINEQTGRRACYLNEFYAKAMVSRMALKHKRAQEDNDIPFDPYDDPME